MGRGSSLAMKFNHQGRNPLLCQKCQVWDSVEAVIEPFDGIHNESTLAELSTKPDCVICRAIATAVDIRRADSETLQALTPSRTLVRNNGPYFLDGGTQPRIIADPASRIDSSHPKRAIIRLVIKLEIVSLLKSPVEDNGSPQGTWVFAMTPQFRLHFSKAPYPHLIAIEPREIPFFDVSLLKTWIQACGNIHGAKCVEKSEVMISNLPAGFRVIDVQSMKIASPIDSVGFVALSYMWQEGGDSDNIRLERTNRRELESEGGLTNIRLPFIISDVISLCKDLGQRYLWVDRQCIIQDDESSKHDQIAGMDTIYLSANLTIIVAVNSRDGEGIPGYRTWPRKSSVWRPEHELDGEGRRLSELNGMRTIVNASLWNKRGWTFQERILSKRRLFVTDFEVIFECSQGRVTEELNYQRQGPPKTPSSWRQSLHRMFSFFVSNLGSKAGSQGMLSKESDSGQSSIFIEESTYGEIDYKIKTTLSLLDYMNWVEDYSSRQLSFSSDIFDAFVGVENQLSKLLVTEMMFGVPEKYLPQALMWSNSGSPEKRTHAHNVPIPSWSWASSLKGVDYYWIVGNTPRSWDYIVHIVTLVYYHIQDPQLGLRKVDIEERWINKEVGIDKFQADEDFYELKRYSKYVPGAWRSMSTWQQCPHSSKQIIAHRHLNTAACSIARSMPGCLVFNTTVTSLKLARDMLGRKTLLDDTPPELDVAIFNSDGDRVGRLSKMSLQWINDHVDRNNAFDFIVICGALADWSTRKRMAQFQKDYDMWRLHVMLVERLPFEPFVVRRIGVGYIFAHKWKDCNPSWETVVLA